MLVVCRIVAVTWVGSRWIVRWRIRVTYRREFTGRRSATARTTATLTLRAGILRCVVRLLFCVIPRTEILGVTAKETWLGVAVWMLRRLLRYRKVNYQPLALSLRVHGCRWIGRGGGSRIENVMWCWAHVWGSGCDELMLGIGKISPGVPSDRCVCRGRWRSSQVTVVARNASRISVIGEMS